MRQEIVDLLNDQYERYNRPGFIEDDPIQIPHSFTKQADIEIMAFFAATIAWGQRKTIINNCKKLAERFDHAPLEFILNHDASDLKTLEDFKHRTFNFIDLKYFIRFLKWHYSKHESLETAFTINFSSVEPHSEKALVNFHDYFFSLDDFPTRTRKHVATPIRKSTCKRLNMFLRWMVRKDERGVDFGLWSKISPAQLLIPFDVHVERVARELKLINRKQKDFLTVLELTSALKELDPQDPCKYDYALFGMGVNK